MSRLAVNQMSTDSLHGDENLCFDDAPCSTTECDICNDYMPEWLVDEFFDQYKPVEKEVDDYNEFMHDFNGNPSENVRSRIDEELNRLKFMYGSK